MLIRTVTREDLPICGEIYSSAFGNPPYNDRWVPDTATEMLSEIFRLDPGSCWCVETEDDGVVAFAFCTTFGRFRAAIQEFAVAPRFQKKGIGATLMAHILDEFRRRSIRMVDLVVNRDAPAFKLYKRFGFAQPGRYLLMAKWL